MILPPVGKSGPFTQRHNCREESFFSAISASSSFSRASLTSPMLCGGMFVAIPTAMPVEPLISRLGILAGRTTGSALVPS